MQKLAKVISILTVAPLMALVLLSWLYLSLIHIWRCRKTQQDFKEVPIDLYRKDSILKLCQAARNGKA